MSTSISSSTARGRPNRYLATDAALLRKRRHLAAQSPQPAKRREIYPDAVAQPDAIIKLFRHVILRTLLDAIMPLSETLGGGSTTRAAHREQMQARALFTKEGPLQADRHQLEELADLAPGSLARLGRRLEAAGWQDAGLAAATRAAMLQKAGVAAAANFDEIVGRAGGAPRWTHRPARAVHARGSAAVARVISESAVA